MRACVRVCVCACVHVCVALCGTSGCTHLVGDGGAVQAEVAVEDGVVL